MTDGPHFVARATPTPRPGLRSLQQLVPRLKIARVLSLPEDSFGQLVLSVERDPLFRKFLHTDDPRFKLFSYQRYPRTGLTAGFLELRDDLSPASGDADIQSLLDEKRDLIDLCHRIGRANFETYFLFADRAGSPETVARACGLTPEEAKRLLELTTQIGIRAEFYNAPASTPENFNAFSRIAHIEREGDTFTIRYTSLRYGRGRYAINYEKMEALKKDPSLTPAEKRALRKLVQSMELVNARRSTMNQILDAVMDHQKKFLISGREEDLKDFTQDRLAAKMGVHPSTVCRAVASKAVLAPWNQELPLRDFLGRGSLHGILADLSRLIEQEEALYRAGKIPLPFRDPELAAQLKKNHGIKIAVRTVSKYRFIAGIPNIYTRAKTYSLSNSGDMID
ncbi:MAG: hypothetical protein IPN90_05750 [Elusimicrobia bacterium]|nr:hypothetical protein [Elusimicrobiota bacterium]